MRSVEQFCHDFARGARAEMSYNALGGGGWDFDLRSGVLVDCTQNIRERRVGRDDCQLSIFICDLRRYRSDRIERDLLNRALGA